jgi:anti-sigma regulatory factor (Ser/Thr protein kinase)
VIVRRSFGPDRTSVAASRRFVVDALNDLPDDIRESAELMMSELATNAVVHAGTGFEVRIERTATFLRVDVTDVGHGEPRLRSPSVSEPHGRGLQIVKQLSDQWGSIEDPDHSGKTVWYLVRLDPGSISEREERTSERQRGRASGDRSGQVEPQHAQAAQDHSGPGTGDAGRTRAFGHGHARGRALGSIKPLPGRRRCRLGRRSGSGLSPASSSSS